MRSRIHPSTGPALRGLAMLACAVLAAGLQARQRAPQRDAAKPTIQTPARSVYGPPTPEPANTVLSADFDYGRLIRVWDVGASTQGRAPSGRRIVMSSNVPAPTDLALLASAGFTLLQTDSDHLSTEQTTPAGWDFNSADTGRLLATRAGFDWCYFPHFAFPPQWYADRIAFARVRCLEHNQEVRAFSPWDPTWPYFIARGYQRLATHFAPPRSAASSPPALYVGVHGDYGECGLMMGARVGVPEQREDWQKRFGDLHNHLGWWCADSMAQGDFRNAMVARYGGIEAVNRAWKTSYSTEQEIAYPASPKLATRRHWLDWVTWYLGSVSKMTDAVSRIARRYFPETLLMLPAGFPSEDPRGGNDNSMLAKIAARHGMALRSTHGAHRPFALNQAGPLGRLASAARFYGAPLWIEPPSKTTPEQQVGRVFEAVSLGAQGYFDWSANIKTGRDVYYRYGKHMRTAERIVDVAMLFPTTSHLLRPDLPYPPTLEQGCARIRDVLDYDIVDERMISDGALAQYRVLVMWEGAVLDQTTLDRVREWIRQGGVLVAYDFGKIESVEGDLSWFRDVLGYAGRLAPATGAVSFVRPADAPPLDAYRIGVGDESAEKFLEGDWYAPESTGGVRRRWTGPNAELRVPVKAGRDLMLTIRASLPAEAAALKHEVTFNGVRVGALDAVGEHTYRFATPASIVGSREVARVGLASEPFEPAKVMQGSTDTRSLGLWVTYVQIETEGGKPLLSDSGPPDGRFEVSVDLRRLRQDWTKQYGQGWTIYFPARRDQLQAYCEVVRYAAYHLSDLDPAKRDAIIIDDSWDGVYATLCTDRALYHNPTKADVLRTIVLSPSAFAARNDIVTPSDYTHTLTIEPDSMQVIPFARPPEEMLLQCEKFTELGGLAPQPGTTFSPSEGKTHVLLPPGSRVSTRFECPSPGEYWVHYRATRRGTPASLTVTVDGNPAPPAPVTRVRPGGVTFRVGPLRLSRGVHTLSVAPAAGQDARADFVVLTSDPTIAAYGFAVK